VRPLYKIIILVIYLLSITGCQHTPAATTTITPTPDLRIPVFDQFTITYINPENGRLIAQLKTEAQKAIFLGRKPYIEFGLENCQPCKAIGDLLYDPMIQAVFEGTYIIQVDVSVWLNQLYELNMPINEWPSFYQIDADGKPTGKFITQADWGGDYTVESMGPVFFAFFQETQ